MATDDDNRKPCDGFAELLGAYEALALLAHSEEGGGSPVYSMLLFINARFRRVLDEADSQGWVS
jgi:hypothetical protein